ncbi:MAG: hypothetical protein SFY95_02605 [Planctomycetota bacterium]|nr:hypothetical protein [Planctomycetota bacterium]
MSPRYRHRRGSAYAVVLSIVLLATVMALGALAALRREREVRVAEESASRARAEALGALEIGVQRLVNAAPWRASVASSGVLGKFPTGAGASQAVSVVIAQSPAGGAISTDLSAPIVLESEAVAGAARQRYRIELTPAGTPIDALTSALHSVGAMTISSAVVRGWSAPDAGTFGVLGSDSSVTASSSTVAAAVYAAGSITGSTYSGGTRANAGLRTMPAVDIFERYRALGTAVNITSIPSRTIQRRVISPGAGAYGVADASGIYVIDAGGNDLTIRDSRIAATLVLINVNRLTIAGCVNWEPAAPGLPALLLQGELDMQPDATELRETSFGVNFNPVSTPYQGSSDADTADSYSNLIRGVVYVSGNAQVRGNSAVIGSMLVGGSVAVSGTVHLRAQLTTITPTGFTTGADFAPVAGSLERVVD